MDVKELGLKEALSMYSIEQIEQIREGLDAGLDVSVYADSTIPYEVMREIRKGLLRGINLIDYYRKGFNFKQLEQIRLGLCSGDRC